MSNLPTKPSHPGVLEPIPYVPGQTTLWNNSWHDLYLKLGDVIIFYARQGGLNDHSAQDVLQEVMMTVLRAQRGETPGPDPAKGSFRMWLKGVVHNRIRSLRRKDQKENALPPVQDSDAEEGPSLPEVAILPDDHEEMAEREWQKAILTAALQRVKERVKPENFEIFMALLDEKAEPTELAATYQKEVNNIYRIKNSCQTMIAEEAKTIRALWEQLRTTPS